MNAGERRTSRKKKEGAVEEGIEEGCLRPVSVVETHLFEADAGAGACGGEVTTASRDWVVHWVQ